MTKKTTGNHTTKFRLKPSELRFILVLGDFLAASIALVISLYVWRPATVGIVFRRNS